MQWLNIYLYYFGIYCLSILLLYFIGRLLLVSVGKLFSLANWRPHENIFGCLLTGTTICVTVFSVCITHLHSINILFFFIAACILQTLKKENKSGTYSSNTIVQFLPKISFIKLVELFLYATVIFSFFALMVIRKADWSSAINLPHLNDAGLYSVNLNVLIQTGQENSYNVHSLIDADYLGMTPYHYYELWMGGILKYFFSESLPIYLLWIVVYSISCFTALVGTWAILEFLKLNTWYFRLIAFLCFFCSGLFVLGIDFFHTQGFFRTLIDSFHDLNIFLFLFPKRFVTYSLLIAFILLFLNHKEVLAFICLLMLPIASVDTFPGVFGGVFLYGLINFKTKYTSYNKIYSVGFIYGIFAIAYLFIYRFCGNSAIPLYNVWEFINQFFVQSRQGLLFPFLIFFRGGMQSILLYAIHGCIIYYFTRRVENIYFKKLLLLAGMMLLSGLAAWAFLFASIDSIQFFIGLLVAFQSIVTILLACWIIANSRSPLSKVLVLSYILLTCSYNVSRFYPVIKNDNLSHDPGYLTAISQYSPHSKIGISIHGKKDFEADWAIRHVITHTMGDDYLIFMSQYLKPLELGGFDIPLDKSFKERPKKIPFLNLTVDYNGVDHYRNKMMMESGIFYRFFEKLKKLNSGVTIDQAQIMFIDHYQLDWGIISPNAEISPLLQKRIQKIFVDDISSEIFVIFKNHSDSL